MPSQKPKLYKKIFFKYRYGASSEQSNSQINLVINPSTLISYDSFIKNPMSHTEKMQTVVYPTCSSGNQGTKNNKKSRFFNKNTEIGTRIEKNKYFSNLKKVTMALTRGTGLKNEKVKNKETLKNELGNSEKSNKEIENVDAAADQNWETTDSPKLFQQISHIGKDMKYKLPCKNFCALSIQLLPDYASKIKTICHPFATVFDVLDESVSTTNESETEDGTKLKKTCSDTTSIQSDLNQVLTPESKCLGEFNIKIEADSSPIEFDQTNMLSIDYPINNISKSLSKCSSFNLPPAMVDKNVLWPDYDVYRLDIDVDDQFIITFSSLDSMKESEDKNKSLSPHYSIRKLNLFSNSCLFSSLIRDQDALELFHLVDQEVYDFAEMMIDFHKVMSSLVEQNLSDHFSKIFSKSCKNTNYPSDIRSTSAHSSDSSSASHHHHFPNNSVENSVHNSEDNSCQILKLIATLTGQDVPKISISGYLARIIKYGNIGCHEIIIAFILISRILDAHPSIGISPLNIHRMILTASCITSKIYKDIYYANKLWSRIGGITTKELNKLEVSFLQLLDYRTHVVLKDYSACFYLVKQMIKLGKSHLYELRTQFYRKYEVPSEIIEQPFANLLFFQAKTYSSNIIQNQ